MSKACCHLLEQVPRELRDIIFAHVLSQTETLVVPVVPRQQQPADPRFVIRYPALSNTCQQIRRETAEALHEYTSWRVLVSESYLLTPILWLDKLNSQSRRQLCNVTVYFEIGETLRLRQDFMKQCASYEDPHRAHHNLLSQLQDKHDRDLCQLLDLLEAYQDIDTAIFQFQVEVDTDVFSYAWKNTWELIIGIKYEGTFSRPHIVPRIVRGPSPLQAQEGTEAFDEAVVRWWERHDTRRGKSRNPPSLPWKLPARLSLLKTRVSRWVASPSS